MPNAPVAASATALPGVNRRTFMARAAAGSASALMAAGSVAASAQIHPDAELLMISSEFEFTIAECEEAFRSEQDLNDEEADHYSSAPFAVARRMAPIRPKTLEGLAAKVAAFIYCDFGQLAGGGFDFGRPDLYAASALIASIHEDLKAMRGEI